MKDHVIVCGAGSTGSYIVAELVAARTEIAVIDMDEQRLEDLDEDVLARAELATARGVVAALSNDKDNLYIVVETRQVNPKARIVAKSEELGHVEKFRRVGADAVVSPPQIGSLRMVSEMMRPTVVRFLDEMLRDKRAYRIEEVTIGKGSSLDGVPLRDAAIRSKFGMSVLAMSNGNSWTYNPDADAKLVGGMTIVVLGSAEQVAKLRDLARAT
jgi:voltage-gated potassium channel